MPNQGKIWVFFATVLSSFNLGVASASEEADVRISVLESGAATFSASAPWDQFLNPAGASSQLRFGVVVQGPDPYQRNQDELFIPASNTKIFTSALALQKLGPGFRFETQIAWQSLDDGHPEIATGLTLIGSGDPTWGMSEFGETLTSRFEQVALELKKRGVTEVRGAIEVRSADSRWDTLRYPEGWEPEDRLACYGALPQAFAISVNCASYVIRSATQGSWVEAGVPIPVKLKLQSVSSGATSISVVSPGAFPEASTSFEVQGRWRKGSSAVSVVLPIHDSKVWARELLKRALMAKGIQYVPKSEASASKTLQGFSIYSPELKDIIVPFMKKSLNVIGDSLIRKMGELHGPVAEADLWMAGKSVMEEFVSRIGTLTAFKMGYRKKLGVFSEGTRFWDGSGVSRENQVSALTVMAVLRDLLVRQDFRWFWNSLPIAGVDGTLAGRMKGTAAQGVLRAKTGTLSGVTALSGFVPKLDKGGVILEFVPFVVLSKGAAGDKEEARLAQDRVGAALARIVNPDREIR